jgi:Flp pilus assembly protein TadG
MGRFGRDARGQSAVEIALAIPLLLILVLGIVDLGRFAYYAIGVSHATRDAAAYAARDSSVGTPEIRERVCGEMNLDGAACAAVVVECTRGTNACDTAFTSATVRVAVSLDLELLTAVVAQRMGMSEIVLRGEATFPGYTQ